MITQLYEFPTANDARKFLLKMETIGYKIIESAFGKSPFSDGCILRITILLLNFECQTEELSVRDQMRISKGLPPMPKRIKKTRPKRIRKKIAIEENNTPQEQ